MGYHLFLDDVRDPDWVHWIKLPALPNAQWVIVRDFDAFVATVRAKGLPAFVSFDHDLDEGLVDQPAVAKTGMDCARWLVEWCMDHRQQLPSFAVHSYNPAGRDNIKGLLEGFRRHCDEEMGVDPTPASLPPMPAVRR